MNNLLDKIVFEEKRHIAAFYSMKLKGHKIGGMPCKHEALASAVNHFSLYIPVNKSQILTDNKPCVQAYKNLQKGKFSALSSASTFLSTVSKDNVTTDSHLLEGLIIDLIISDHKGLISKSQAIFFVASSVYNIFGVCVQRAILGWHLRLKAFFLADSVYSFSSVFFWRLRPESSFLASASRERLASQAPPPITPS